MTVSAATIRNVAKLALSITSHERIWDFKNERLGLTANPAPLLARILI